MRREYSRRIDRPTRITEFSATLIDHIITNVHNNNTMSGVWVADIADHLPIYVTLPYVNNIERRPNFKMIRKRVYTPEKTDAFKNALLNYDWSDIIKDENVNEKYDHFIGTITELHNAHFPLITMKIKRLSEEKPWITKAILNSIKKKNSMYKMFIKSRSETLLIRYKAYKNKLQTVIRQAEKQFYSSKIEKCRDSISMTWKVLNTMINKKSTSKKINQIEINGAITEILKS